VVRGASQSSIILILKAVKILEKPHDERVAALKKKALDDIGLRSMPSKLQEAIRVI